MIKYFIPKETITEIQEIIRDIKFQNDYNRAIFEFDSSEMDMDKQLIHKIIKLKESFYNNVYSSDKEELCVSLLDSLKRNKDNVYMIKETDEELLLFAIATVLRTKKCWFGTIDRKERPNLAMDCNYTIIIKAIESIKVISNDENIVEINEKFNKFIAQFEPCNMLINDLKETNIDDSELVIEVNGLTLNTKIEDIKITKDKIEIIFNNGNYIIDKNRRILPIAKENNSWSYEIDDFAIIKNK